MQPDKLARLTEPSVTYTIREARDKGGSGQCVLGWGLIRALGSRLGYLHLDVYRRWCYTPVDGQMKEKSEVLQGTLDLLVLKTLDVMGPMHGYGIAQRIQQVSEQILQLNQGTLYPALLRLEQRGWVGSGWGISDNNRRARFYSITRSGRKQLAEERLKWKRVAGAIERLLEAGA